MHSIDMPTELFAGVYIVLGGNMWGMFFLLGFSA